MMHLLTCKLVSTVAWEPTEGSGDAKEGGVTSTERTFIRGLLFIKSKKKKKDKLA